MAVRAARAVARARTRRAAVAFAREGDEHEDQDDRDPDNLGRNPLVGSDRRITSEGVGRGGRDPESGGDLARGDGAAKRMRHLGRRALDAEDAAGAFIVGRLNRLPYLDPPIELAY